MSDPTYVDVLMEEYRALRGEVAQRISSGTQLLGFGVAAVGLSAGAASKDVLSKPGVIVSGGLALLALLIYWVRTSYLIRLAGERLRHLETEINAAFAGKDPLSWERWLHTKRSARWSWIPRWGRSANTSEVTTPAVE